MKLLKHTIFNMYNYKTINPPFSLLQVCLDYIKYSISYENVLIDVGDY